MMRPGGAELPSRLLSAWGADLVGRLFTDCRSGRENAESMEGGITGNSRWKSIVMALLLS